MKQRKRWPINSRPAVGGERLDALARPTYRHCVQILYPLLPC